jgi:sigma-B regulation protein RsbU (phosphoserine phosphatase)
VVGRPGSLLGVLEDGSWHDTVLSLEPGNALVLYTDGVTEGRRGHEFYGTARLAAVITAHHGSAQSLADTVTHDVLNFQSGNPRDDIAVVVVAVPPAEAGILPRGGR